MFPRQCVTDNYLGKTHEIYLHRHTNILAAGQSSKVQVKEAESVIPNFQANLSVRITEEIKFQDFSCLNKCEKKPVWKWVHKYTKPYQAGIHSILRVVSACYVVSIAL